MGFRSTYVFAGVLLLASNITSEAVPQDDKGNVLRALAGRIGHVLGAASACKGVERARINGIADRITDVIKSSAANEKESAAILETFNAAEAEGAWAVTAKQTDCNTAGRELADLESASAPAQQSTAENPAQPAEAAASPSQSPSAATHTAFAGEAGTAAVRGVTNNEIRFGISAPLSGPAKDLGQQMRRGIEVAFDAANDAGGINGRKLQLIAADDGYEPSRTTETMKLLTDKDQVFGFIGNVGTPTAAVSAPYALEHRMLFFGAFTGAGLLRRDPPDRYIFNYRASYAEETEAVVHYLVKVRHIKPEQIAVFAQQDGYGDSGFAGVAKAMRTLHGGETGLIFRMGYQRNTIDVDSAVAQLKAHRPAVKAVVMVATYRAAAKFIEKTRDAYPGLIYTNVSFVGSTSLRDELMLLGPKYASGVIVTQVVPAVSGYSSFVLQYKNALAKYAGGETPDYVSLEGFVAAQVLIEALKRAGPQLDTEKVVDAIENMQHLDLGLGTMVNFGRSEHQGSHKVWGTQLNDAGKFEPIDLD